MSREIHRNCIRKVGTTEQDISSCQKGIIDRANEKQTCYLKCVLHEIALMDDNGKLTPVKALKVLPLNSLSKFGPIVAGCGKIDDSNPCMKATKIFECAFQNYPTLVEVP
ncbi:hypothetical protein RUM44_001614 [Polyplax serrata]|uniref:Uncharacterized protein n=1 Tax=Polyplax serrata TaxID=468196 RepID=A0ABR1AKI2_POLSC